MAMNSFTSNIKHSMNSLIRFIHDGSIIENESQIEINENHDSIKESSPEKVQNKDRVNGLTGKHQDSCWGHFF